MDPDERGRYRRHSGARNEAQAKGNAAAAELAALSADVVTATREIYARLVARTCISAGRDAEFAPQIWQLKH
jgi:hypothetical protein